MKELLGGWSTAPNTKSKLDPPVAWYCTPLSNTHKLDGWQLFGFIAIRAAC